jgi:hypothetical protein
MNTALLFGSDRDRAMREMADVMKFEIALANVSFVKSSFHNFSHFLRADFIIGQSRFEVCKEYIFNETSENIHFVVGLNIYR